MIFKITWEDGRWDCCTAENMIHLLKAYDKDYDLCLQEIETVEEVSEEDAKKDMYVDHDSDDDSEVSLWELAFDDNFRIIASSEF